MANKSSLLSLTSYRIEVALRILLAVAGGYVCTVATIIFLVKALPLTRSDAVVISALLSFTIFTLAVIWVFASRNLRRAALGLLLPTVIFGLLGFIFPILGGAQ
ncbi:MAG TPA: DUF3649 domain-containing protein [Cellvibrionaceae bacterium]